MNGFSLFLVGVTGSLGLLGDPDIEHLQLRECSAAADAPVQMTVHPTSTQNATATIPQPEDSDYEKWSRMAFKEAGKIYTLLDYKYLGKSYAAPGVYQQQFRFWIKKNKHEFPLIVTIRYNSVTEKVYTIQMEEQKGACGIHESPPPSSIC
ncbi:DUF3889 domain-containing protein [Paenibacillus hexagrammi]|uniref:YqzG/YhdC family protein n=1 Tax=Paenibacillus hexagrammi TaxID=2908839 RepID=A0ABY3SD91_9BACL|nr:DUF3889 domain-containing protein [Paenibacillus sp. YPD9-1]UJF31953.1 YqzG/YhdC family protein [Paenibacillus sp. YPD9-1]